MKFVADFHIHSKYSRATSRDMDIPHLAEWARLKGIRLMGTGDFTHYLWLQDLKRNLTAVSNTGLYEHEGVSFILSAEISTIFSQDGKSYRVHTVLLAPSFEIVDAINQKLSSYGNIASDGRPILGISCRVLAEEMLRISRDIMIIPAHIWTPWFSVFGSNSGFNALEDAFGDATEHLTALETGLSSDPLMNWRLSQLDRFSLISNSDSHSPARIGREANVFDCELNYWEIKKVLEQKDRKKFLYTIEFFPEEGKYHYDGHRLCHTRLHPEETKKNKGLCPKCGKKITVGVLSRVDELADRAEGFIPENSIPYRNAVPLDEIIAEAKGLAKSSKAVLGEYRHIVSAKNSEFQLLIEATEEELKQKTSLKIAEGILRVRQKKIRALAGYDGEYGSIEVFGKEPEKEKQFSLF